MDSESDCAMIVVSPHIKGFWQADVYQEGWMSGMIPDWFCTGSKDGTREEVVAKALAVYPAAKVVEGMTGACIDCGEEHFNLEELCADCGGIVSD